jgi:hypothetical protein
MSNLVYKIGCTKMESCHICHVSERNHGKCFLACLCTQTTHISTNSGIRSSRNIAFATMSNLVYKIPCTETAAVAAEKPNFLKSKNNHI